MVLDFFLQVYAGGWSMTQTTGGRECKLSLSKEAACELLSRCHRKTSENPKNGRACVSWFLDGREIATGFFCDEFNWLNVVEPGSNTLTRFANYVNVKIHADGTKDYLEAEEVGQSEEANELREAFATSEHEWYDQDSIYTD